MAATVVLAEGTGGSVLHDGTWVGRYLLGPMDQGLVVSMVDMVGSFAFASSGAVAAKERRLDWFGVVAVSYLTACGGGIVRDLCLGVVPPVGISAWRYPVCAIVASAVTIGAGSLSERLKRPVAFFDSVGLGFFAVGGAHQAMQYNAGVTVAVVLGMVSAVGGGVMRDVLLNRVPLILEREIYALAALVAAAIQALSEANQGPLGLTQAVAISACLVIRFFALRFKWTLPVA